MTSNSKSNPSQLPTLQWRIPEIDGVRAFAMLMVVLYHTWEFAGSPKIVLPILNISLGSLISTFPAGVDLFMVLSGFCLFLPLCRNTREEIKFDVKTYVQRRIRRIVPPYYAAIAFAIIFPNVLVVLFRLLGREANWQSIPSVLQILTHLSFTHLFFTETWDGITGAFWSLGLEAQFYLAFPIVVLLYKRHGIKAFWWMIAISVLYRIGVSIGFEMFTDQKKSIGFSPFEFLWHTNLFGRWMQFAAGMWAAHFVGEYWKSGKNLNANTGTLLIVAGVSLYSLVALAPSLNSGYFPFRDFLLSISYVLLLISVCVSRTKIRGFFATKTMNWLGYISYSIFLIHQPIIYYCGEMLERFVPVEGTLKYAVLIVVGFSATLLITLPFFALFEKPFMKGMAKRKPETKTENLELEDPQAPKLSTG